MISIGPGQVTKWAVGNSLQPAENPQVVCATLFFGGALQSTYDIALSNLFNNQSQFSMVQTVFIDNSGSDVPTTITCAKSGQVIIARGRTQGYYPLVAPNDWDLVATNTTSNAGVLSPAVIVFVMLMNFFQPPAVWSTGGAGGIN